MSKAVEPRRSNDLTMKAVVVYDDFSAAARATATLQRIGRQAEVRVQWDIRPWQVNILREAEIRETALLDTLDAHLILFAGRRAHAVPVWVRDWLETWARTRKIQDAALGVIGDVVGLAQPGNCELSALARKHGLNFITDERAAAADATRLSIRFSPEQEMRLTVRQPLLVEMAASGSYRYAGIND